MTPGMCLALAVFFEAREYHATNPDALAGVAAVVQNRVADGRWPANVCDVVFQPRQFAWTGDGQSDDPRDYPTYFDAHAWTIAQHVAVQELAGDGLAITSTHFHDMSETPYWTDRMAFDGQMGTLRFYTEN